MASQLEFVEAGQMIPNRRVMEILSQAKSLAQEYRILTGKPLGITGEVAEYEAARILGVQLTSARQAGFDATDFVGGKTRKLQIKGRCLQSASRSSQRLGRIDVNKDWDAVLMVLLDENFEATEIYEASRAPILAALSRPGSKARNVRGALDVRAFKRIGVRRWPS
jgi:hypothetical protein